MVSRGATVHRLMTEQIRSLAICPLEEQRRIVAILDEVFEGIAAAVVNAEKSLAYTRELFKVYLNSIFIRLSEGWVERPLETVASILNGYAFKNAPVFLQRKATNASKITNVGVGDFVRSSDGYLPDSFAAEYDTVSVKKGSILVALTRTIIAGGLKVAVVPNDYDGALLNQRVASIIPNNKQVNDAYLFAYFATPRVVNYVTDRVNTLMQPNLSIKDLRSMPIPVPPRREQDTITERLETLREKTQNLESTYLQKLAGLAVGSVEFSENLCGGQSTARNSLLRDDTHSFGVETQRRGIDPALAAAGWGVVDGSRISREYRITEGRLEGHGRRGKPTIADYVLIYRNTKLAVVEAKA